MTIAGHGVPIEPDPAIPPGCACAECERPYGLPHLGTCGKSLMMGGSGIVGFRKAAAPVEESDAA